MCGAASPKSMRRIRRAWPLGRSWESARTLSFSRQAIAAWSLRRDACCDVNRTRQPMQSSQREAVCHCMPKASALEMARVSSGFQFALSSASVGTFGSALWRGDVDGVVLSDWLSRERTCFSVAWSSWDKVLFQSTSMRLYCRYLR